VAFHSRDPSNPSLDEVIGALTDAALAPPAAAADAPIRRVVQRAMIDGLLDLAGHRNATSEVRATVTDHLVRLRDRAANPPASAPNDPETRGHHAAIIRDIDRYFEGRDDPDLRPRPAPIPLPWP
jgi:hypothetical protein